MPSVPIDDSGRGTRGSEGVVVSDVPALSA
jgi:hypothetical protein